MSMTEEWANLPTFILTNIYSNMQWKDCIQASATCTRWREAFFHPSLWRTKVIKLINRNSVHYMTFLLERNLFSYMHNVSFYWPNQTKSKEISKDIMQVILNSLDHFAKYSHIRKLVFRIENKLIMDESSLALHKKLFRNKISIILSNSPLLEYLSFGYNRELIPFDLMDNLQNCHKLKELHISCNQSNSLQTIERNNHKELTCAEMCAEDGRKIKSTSYNLCSLTVLSINWVDLTDNMLERITISQLTKLNIFVKEHIACNHPSKETWDLAISKLKGLQIVLCFIEDVSGVCNHLKHVPNVYMVKFCEIDHYDDLQFEQVVTWHQDTLEAQVMVYTRTAGVEVMNGSSINLVLNQCSNMKYKTVIGHYIPGDILASYIKVMKQNGSMLENFIVSQENIRSFAEASDYEIAISGAKYRKLCFKMTKFLGREWVAINKKTTPLKGHYFCDGKDDIVYTSNMPQSLLRKLGSNPLALLK